MNEWADNDPPVPNNVAKGPRFPPGREEGPHVSDVSLSYDSVS